MSRNQRSIPEYFEKRVECYEAAYLERMSGGVRNAVSRFGWFPLRLIFRHTASYLSGIRMENALDVGCGTGIYSTELASRGVKVTALDCCEKMVDATRRRVTGLGLDGRVEALLADYDDWSKGNRKNFDLLLAIGVLDYVDDAVRYLSSFAMIAGDVIVTFPARSLFSLLAHMSYRRQGVEGYSYSRQEVENLLASGGMETISFTRLFPATYWVHARRTCAVNPSAHGNNME